MKDFESGKWESATRWLALATIFAVMFCIAATFLYGPVGAAAGVVLAVLAAVLQLHFSKRTLRAVRVQDGDRVQIYRESLATLKRYLASGFNYDKVLDDALRLSNAEFGFVGVVLYDDEGNPYLSTKAITNIAWDQDSRAAYSAEGMEFRNLETLFGFTLRTSKHLITNVPSEHSEAGGFPNGHPVVNSYMGVPLIAEGKLVGMFGLANRPGGFVIEDLRQWQSFFDVCAATLYHSRLEQEITAANESYRRLFEEAPIMFVVTEPAGSPSDGFLPLVSDCNKAFLDRLGYSRDTVRGRPFAEFYDKESQVRLTGGGYSRVLSGEVVEEGRVLIAADGSAIPVRIKAVPVFGQHGTVVGSLAMFIDVSELFESEAWGRSIESTVRSFMTSSNLFFVEFDSELRTLSASKGLRRLLKFHKGSDSDFDFFSLLSSAAQHAALERIVRLGLNGEQGIADRSLEVTVASRYGTEMDLVLDFVDISLKESETPSVWFAAYDLSKKNLEVRLEAESRRAQSLEILTGSIAHEFNNILTVLSRNLTFLGNPRFSLEERSEIIDDVDRSVAEGFDLTQTLLAYSGKKVLRPVTVDLETAVRNVLGRSGILAAPGFDVRLNVDTSDTTCSIDPEAIETVIWDVLENSIEASSGQTVVEITLSDCPLSARDRIGFSFISPGVYLCLTIRDFGEGIKAEFIDRVLDPFFSTKAKQGLGLSNVAGTIRQSAGALLVESVRGEGTAVTALIPRPLVPSSGIVVAKLIERLQNFSGRIICITEDKLVARFVSSALEGSQVHVSYAERCHSLKTEGSFDAIVLDGRLLNEMGGFNELLRDNGATIIIDHPFAQSIDESPRCKVVKYPATSIELIEALEPYCCAYLG